MARMDDLATQTILLFDGMPCSQPTFKWPTHQNNLLYVLHCRITETRLSLFAVRSSCCDLPT